MRIRNVVGSLVLGITIAGCSFIPGSSQTFASSFPAEEGVADTAVLVTDHTGLMTDLIIDPQIQPPPPEGVADHPDGLVVTWIGGACDASVEFAFEQNGSAYTLTGTTVTTGDACILIGIERRIQLKLRTPVPAASVDFSMGDRPL